MSMRRKGPLLATLLAACVGAAILVTAFLIEPGAERDVPAVKPRIVEATDLQAPAALRPDEGMAGGKALDAQGVSLSQGAWVQVADESGKLAQQYSASRIDPERDKWMRMEQPRAVMYPSGGRMVTMKADRGRMRVPQRAIESGRLEGSVVIRMYKPVDGKAIDTDHDEPALVVQADEALFDNRLGEIRCDRRVKVTTDQLQFEGEGLTMLLMPDGKTIERLTVERPLSPIQIVRRVATVAEDAPPQAKPAGGPRWEPGQDASKPAAPTQGVGVNAAPAAARFYRLVLERNVRVARQGPKGLTRIDGDRLIAVFSLESDAVGSNLASAMDRGFDLLAASDDGQRGGAATLPLLLLSGAMGAADDVERTEIRYEGRLTMAITNEPGDRLASKDDVRVEITGSPTKLDDQASGARVDCGTLRYTTGADAVMIEGQKDRRFVLASPRLDLEATRFELDRRSGKGDIQGAGRMRLGGADGAAMQAASNMPAAAADALRDGTHTVNAPDAQASARTVRMEWTKAVVLAFEPGGTTARLRSADFTGGVKADADEVKMEAEHLLVECVAQGSRDAVKRLLAEGPAKATRLPAGSSLGGQRVELFLEPLEDGGSRPTRLLAEGGVEAADKGQRLWAESMDCSFRPVDGAPASAERMDVSEVRTKGEVQALVSQDARVWAAAMDADPAQQRVVLRGPDLLMVRGNAVADQMSEIEMNESTGEGSAPGAGRCRYFLKSVADSTPKPMPRPAMPEVAQMVATWTDGLLYRRLDAATSVVQLSGGVQAKANRTSRQQEELSAKQALLTLTRDAARLNQASRDVGRGSLGGETSSLTRMRATGEVKLESRAWGKDDRSDEPRLFRLMAEDLTHDMSTGETEVPTAGTLLMFDRDDEGVKSAPASLFDGRGTTRFRWAKRLEMKRDGSESRYLIDMDGDVELLHAGLRKQDTFTLTCDQLQTTVERTAAETVPAARDQAQPVDMGGPVKLLRVQGLGRVFVRTAEMDVECDSFDYDLHTQIARMSARPGRTVTVLQKGLQAQPTPIRAETALWDMQTGRIRIIGGSGSGVR